MLRQAIRIL